MEWNLEILIISVVLSVFSCEEFCEESTRAAVVVNFYTLDTNLELTRNNVSIQGLNNDSVLYANANLAVALLPLNPNSDTTVYLVTADDIADTVHIVYTRHAGFISSECGCAGFSDLTHVESTANLIKEVQIINPDVRTVSYRNNIKYAENIRIYY
jgi:hypothetical protein